MRRLLALCMATSQLAGCATLIPTPGEPTKKYVLDALGNSDSSYNRKVSKHHHHQLIVDLPTLYPPLDNTRIALKPSEQLIDYYADVEWADRLNTLIQESLIYSLQSQSGLQGVCRPTEGIHADYALKIEVRKFYVAQMATPKNSIAQVEYMVHLVKMPERRIVASHLFTHVQTISENTMDMIVKALNAAHLETSKALVPWVLERLR